MTADAIKNYTLRISQANKSEIIVIVFELADLYMEEAVSNLKNGQKDDFTEACHNARRCVTHLMNALEDTYDIANLLMSIYVYINKEISMSAARYDEKRLMKVKELLKSLSEAFVEVSKADASSPIMGNPQTVYAGLTYGKGSLNESLYDEGARRGYTV